MNFPMRSQRWLLFIFLAFLSLPLQAYKIRSVRSDVMEGKAIISITWMQARKIARGIGNVVVPANSGAVGELAGVVQIYIDVNTGKVVFTEVLEAKSVRIAESLKDVPYRWIFEKGDAGKPALLTVPVALYFGGMEGAVQAIEVAE